MQIGYARVSTEDQNLALQLDALRNAGCDRIFCDEGLSGALVSRPALDRALKALSPGDILVTWKLDRLGRSLGHLIAIIEAFASRDIGFRSLSENIDTTTPSGVLLFHVVGAIAQFERALISERTRAGMASARARGIHVGRKPRLAIDTVREAKLVLDAGATSLSELAGTLGVAPVTLIRALQRLDEAA